MTERWIQVVIEPRGSLQRSEMRAQIYGAIRKLVRELEIPNLLQSFHFFHEYGNVELRIQYVKHTKNGVSDTKDKVKDFIDWALKDCVAVLDYTVNDDYEGEQDKYGKDGWPIAKMFFEASSILVLTEWDTKANLGPWFQFEKFLHCLDNQHFANTREELTFFAQFVEHYADMGVHPIKTQIYDKSWGKIGNKLSVQNDKSLIGGTNEKLS